MRHIKWDHGCIFAAMIFVAVLLVIKIASWAEHNQRSAPSIDRALTEQGFR